VCLDGGIVLERGPELVVGVVDRSAEDDRSIGIVDENAVDVDCNLRDGRHRARQRQVWGVYLKLGDEAHTLSSTRPNLNTLIREI